MLSATFWSSATFWPLLFEKQNGFIDIIHEILYLPSTVLQQRDYGRSFIGSKNFDSHVMALYLKIKNTSTIHCVGIIKLTTFELHKIVSLLN